MCTTLSHTVIASKAKQSPSLAEEGAYFFSSRQRIRLQKKINTEGLVQKAVDQLYENKRIDKRTNRKMLQATYEPLRQAVNEGLGKIVAKVEYGTPNYEFLRQLQTNTAVFAAFKNHSNIKEMAALLKDENGNRRSREEFKKAALEVNSKYNTRYLDVEYNTAVRQARSAAQWEKAVKTKRLYPNIKYLPSVSANNREEHVTFYGLIRPIDDPIWSTILPPNGWECKCRWEVSDEEPTDIPDNLEAPQQGFDFNPGKSGQIFDIENSGYIKSVPPAMQPKLIKEAVKIANWQLASEAEYVNVYASKSGTDVLAHPLAFKNSDFQTTLNHARQLANDKSLPIKEIEILPTVRADNPLEAPFRNKLLPAVKGSSNPDYRIDGKYFDLKEVLSDKINPKRTIPEKIGDARSQADGIVLVIENKNIISQLQLYKNINAKYYGNKELYKDFELYLKYNNKWQHFNQKKWSAFYRAYIKGNPL